MHTNSSETRLTSSQFIEKLVEETTWREQRAWVLGFVKGVAFTLVVVFIYWPKGG